MQMLIKRISNEIVREASLRLHWNVNIMNTEGIIISALDKSCVAAIYEGALKVLTTKKPLLFIQDRTGKTRSRTPTCPSSFLIRLLELLPLLETL